MTEDAFVAQRGLLLTSSAVADDVELAGSISVAMLPVR
jgi:hypothetical protein